MSKNIFGGKNKYSLYVPLSEDEQEVLHRLVSSDDLRLVIHDWGYVDNPQVIVGEYRVGIKFRMNFSAPDAPMPVWYFDLELRTRSGVSIFKERLPCAYNGNPVQVCAGMFLDLQWDIALKNLDPKLVKMIKPGAKGLTSRRQDKDTGLMTTTGNMRLTEAQRRALQAIESHEKAMRQEDAEKLSEAIKKSGSGH